MGDDVGVLVEFVQMLGELAKRNERGSGYAADLKFMRLANVDQLEAIAAIELGFHLNGVRLTLRQWW